jgi:hypothetical protein
LDWTAELGFTEYRSVGPEGSMGFRITMLTEDRWRAYRLSGPAVGGRALLKPLGTYVSLAAAKNACALVHLGLQL